MPPSSRAVEVNLLATAGMQCAERLHGRPAVESLYGVIRDGVGRHGFTVGDVRTTCGSEEEGIWTWINLNDMLVRAFDEGHEPVGIVEVGGSSLQLTFPTDEDPDAVPTASVLPAGTTSRPAPRPTDGSSRSGSPRRACPTSRMPGAISLASTACTTRPRSGAWPTPPTGCPR
jgi:hypothetical protein